MLIQKAPTTGDVVAIKLINNDELVARIVDDQSTYIIVEKPVLLAISMDPATGRPAINMLPFWMMGAESDAKLNFSRQHILAMTHASKDTKSSWQQMTTSLITPGGGSGLVV